MIPNEWNSHDSSKLDDIATTSPAKTRMALRYSTSDHHPMPPMYLLDVRPRMRTAHQTHPTVGRAQAEAHLVQQAVAITHRQGGR